MPLQVPIIDDRNYDDIVAELRTRIARYTPEWKPQWNDLNDSDPGMILAQTFAWLSEMLLYRMGRVPEANYIKFLELIGIELRPAQSATADVSFALQDTWLQPMVWLPPRTQVSAPSDNGPPVIFETERQLAVVACQLQAVQVYDAAEYRDVSAENSEPATFNGFHPFGESPRKDAALVLGFTLPAAFPNRDQFPPLSLDLTFWAAEASAQEAVQTCVPKTPSFTSARLSWEGWNGTHWQPVDALNDETLAFTRSGHIELRIAESLGLKRGYLGSYDGVDPVSQQPREALFWLRGRLSRAQYDRPPRLLAVRTNTVPALQAQTVQGEILGGTSGLRNQVFQIENTPVIPGSLEVQIDEGTPEEDPTWEVLEDLFGAGPTNKQLAVNWTSGELRAGDGEHGQVPVANADNPDTNVVVVSYRFGGGAEGNLGAGSIDTLLTPVEGVDTGKISNLFATSGGRDEERLEDAKIRARQALRARDRAVSVDDFELLAKQAGDVKRAKALPLTHPRFPGVDVPGAITVIIVPDAPDPKPLPTTGLLQTVCAYLDMRRLLTTELFVVAPHYVEVEVHAEVVVTDQADPGKVKLGAEDSIREYLHPLHGGDDGSGFPFGGTLRYSKLVQRLFNVEGVDSVPRLILFIEGEAQPECRDVAISSGAGGARHALAYSTEHHIEVFTPRQYEEFI